MSIKDGADKTVGSTVPFKGKRLTLHVDEIERDGKRRTIEYVTHGQASVMIARPDIEHLVITEQWRHAVGQRVWEIPAGVIDPGENPEEAAHRELREETGYTAKRCRHLWSSYSGPAYTTEILHFYLLEDLMPGPREPDIGEESMIVRIIRLDELQHMIDRGEIQDLKTLLAITWAREQLLQARLKKH